MSSKDNQQFQNNDNTPCIMRFITCRCQGHGKDSTKARREVRWGEVPTLFMKCWNGTAPRLHIRPPCLPCTHALDPSSISSLKLTQCVAANKGTGGTCKSEGCRVPGLPKFLFVSAHHCQRLVSVNVTNQGTSQYLLLNPRLGRVLHVQVCCSTCSAVENPSGSPFHLCGYSTVVANTSLHLSLSHHTKH